MKANLADRALVVGDWLLGIAAGGLVVLAILIGVAVIGHIVRQSQDGDGWP